MVKCEYRQLSLDEIEPQLFGDFVRRQVVTDCLRRVNGMWVVQSDPFIDDWSGEDYLFLVKCLKNTVTTGGFVCGAFLDGRLKSFVSVENELFGGENKYLDLTCLHVSEDMRRNGMGKALFLAAADWARKNGGRKLYISSHSAVESQRFYKAMGCVDAEVYCKRHTEEEPFDRQLEYVL